MLDRLGHPFDAVQATSEMIIVINIEIRNLLAPIQNRRYCQTNSLKVVKLIRSAREDRILSVLARQSNVTIAELCLEFPGVSAVSIRRDIARLAAREALVRTHGGARVETKSVSEDLDGKHVIETIDAIVLPPIEGRGIDTLRLMAKRRCIPFLAESSPQAGGIYVGPDNAAAGRDLGLLAGRLLAGSLSEAEILLVSLDDLPNTRARCDGFLEGFEAAFGRPVRTWRINGQGSFRVSRQASLDLLATVPTINVAFGVNDHSILAALDAAESMKVDLAGFSVGGEGPMVLDALAAGQALKACTALFPEIVGMRAVDALADAFAGAGLPAEICTPHAVLTPETLSRYYRRTPGGYRLTQGVPALLGLPVALAGHRPKGGTKRSIGFLPHYPAHEWYRAMARAMDQRAGELGLELHVLPPAAGIAHEIGALRKLIAGFAAGQIKHGDTVLINAGPLAMALAEAIEAAEGVTIVTNSFDVLSHLSGRPALKVILTSGEYQAKDRCLVGPSLGALFESMRIDKAFLSVDGISMRFGASCIDERLALAARRFVEASREVFVLADHSLVGVEASHRIVPARALRELVTDSGSLPADRMALAGAGLRITLADREGGADDASVDLVPPGMPDRMRSKR